MRCILPFFILTVTGCSGQQTTEQQNKIDTTKLFNPNPESDETGASDMNIFKRNIVLIQPDYYIILNGQEHKLETVDKVKEFIKSNEKQIQKEKFYIITDSSTAFKKTVSIINILVENRITNYKVINVQKYLTPPEPITIQSPTSVINTYNENDSTYFSIIILNNGINVRLFGQETKLKNTGELDEFIGTHKSDIKKVIIIASRELSDNKFKPVLEVLKKHEYYKYNLVTK